MTNQKITRCEGCDSNRPCLSYAVTPPAGRTRAVRYCDDCAALARCDWNGETAAISEVFDRDLRAMDASESVSS